MFEDRLEEPVGEDCDICGLEIAEGRSESCPRCGLLCCRPCLRDHVCENALEEGFI